MLVWFRSQLITEVMSVVLNVRGMLQLVQFFQSHGQGLVPGMVPPQLPSISARESEIGGMETPQSSQITVDCGVTEFSTKTHTLHRRIHSYST